MNSRKKISFNSEALCLFSDKLDGLRTGTKRKRDWEAIASRMEDYLQLPDDYDTRASEPGKKRVIHFQITFCRCPLNNL